MKKTLILAAAAIAALSACTKEAEVTPINDTKAPVFTATIEPETKTQLVEGSTAGKLTKVAWLNTDQVFIAAENGTTAALMGTYSVTPKSDATTATLNPVEPLTYFKSEVTPDEYVAIYPASISTLKSQTAEGIGGNNPDELYGWYSRSINLPQNQKYNGTDISQIAPMAAISGNTELKFQNLTALLAITVKAEDFSSVSSITVSTNEEAGFALAGDFTIDINQGVLSVAVDGWGTKYNSITLNCQNAGANTTIPAEGKTFYVSIPANTYEYLQIEVNGKKISADVQATMKTKAASISVERNKIYEIAFADNQTPAADPNLLAGEFSVSATKKVKFTKGNLYWTGSAYQFEANQTAYPTSFEANRIGHFFWNSDAEYNKTGDNAYTYKPYYSSYSHLESKSTDEFWCSEGHKLEVAGTQGLYTLSADEWAYLLNPPYLESSTGRTQTNRFARARVNNTNGYLIFPDGYNGETAVSGKQGIGTVNEDGNSGYPSENIPDATWSAMEAAGVVFLPNAGIRKGTAYNNSGYGKYWSSTPDDDVSNAKNVYFDANGIVYCPGNTYRSDGSSIRLVKTVE